MSSWSHRALAPIATAWRAMSGASAAGRNNSPRSILSSTSASDGYTGSPNSTSANGLMGMIRKPRCWRPKGTEPPALSGSLDAPTTAIVVVYSRTSLELRPIPNSKRPAVPDIPEGLGRLGDGFGRLFERELQDFLHAAGQVEGHRVAHALGDIVDVLFVAARKDDFREAHPVCSQHLLLDAADRQHQPLERDLAGHAH